MTPIQSVYLSHDATARIEASRPRATAPGVGRRFEQALEASATVVLDGVEAASSLVPGGGIVSAAVRGLRSGARAASVASAGTNAEGATTGGAGGLGDVHSAIAQDNVAFLELQQQMQAENRRFTTLSNVMKARHETAKNSIGNIR